MLIYFAGPLFNQAEKEFNKKLADKLEKLGFKVFLPQRDGVERNKSPFDAISKDEVRKEMFNLDEGKIIEADIFLFILDGRVPDEGACVELGLAYAYKNIDKSGKLLIGLQTDIRAAYLGGKLNPMIKIPLDKIFEKESDLIEFLKE